MSEVTGSDGFPETDTDRMIAVITAIAGCVGESLEGICSYGWTIGEYYVPFNPDPEDECEDDETVACSQAWVRVTGVSEAEVSNTGFDGSTCASVLSVGLEIGVLRCLEIPEDGEAPTATEVLAAAMQMTADMNDIRCAVLSCETAGLDPVVTVGQWVPDGPLGGQYGGIWTFVLEI